MTHLAQGCFRFIGICFAFLVPALRIWEGQIHAASGGTAWPVGVDASTNLLDWQGLTTFWVGPGPAVVTDTAATNYPARLYRAQPVP